MLPVRGGIAEKERKGWRKRDVGSRDEQRDTTVSRSGHIGTNAKSKRSSEPSHRVNRTVRGKKPWSAKCGSSGLDSCLIHLAKTYTQKCLSGGDEHSVLIIYLLIVPFPYTLRRLLPEKRIMPSPPPYTCWASADKWWAGFVILAANVDAIPTPPPWSGVVIGVDGLWGAHEWTIYPQPHCPKFPYLAWIPLHLSDVMDKLTVEWTTLKAALQDPFSDMSSHPRLPIQRPMKAYTRGFKALSRLKQDFGAWRDFVEVFQNLQRSLLELHAFLDWWKDIFTGDYFRSPVCAPTRGAIFEDAHHYANYPLLHSLHHWYYPPLVCDVVTELETAARGYAEHLDSFNPTKEVKPSRRAKRAKADMDTLLINNPELRHLTDAGAVPDWFPGIQDIWTHAMGHVSHLNLASQKSPHRFALPPVHLFWGGEPPNQRTYYYHYLLLFNEIRNWPERDLPGLTTQEWRSILGNTYWKKQWPRHDGNNPLAFDPNMFWKYGGSLLFSDVRSADITAGRYNPTSLLSCHCDIQLATTDDTDIRQVYEEIREIERLQFLTTFEKRWQSQYLELNQILEMWDLSGGCSVDPKFFRKKVWRSWVQAVRDLIVDWDGFEQWDWGGFSKKSNEQYLYEFALHLNFVKFA
ncbi:hypothetical protein EDB83DRAFT_2312384 [Lactarius deliciosus]|nr:hypothetical protein EDB83DRAFT_2312384 [Lactarius deliciosus]